MYERPCQEILYRAQSEHMTFLRHIYEMMYIKRIIWCHTRGIDGLRRKHKHVREEEDGDLTTALAETGALVTITDMIGIIIT